MTSYVGAHGGRDMTTAKHDAAGVPASRQMLTFVLGNETYGVDILRVQEIRGWSAVTKIPQAPAHVAAAVATDCFLPGPVSLPAHRT